MNRIGFEIYGLGKGENVFITIFCSFNYINHFNYYKKTEQKGILNFNCNINFASYWWTYVCKGCCAKFCTITYSSNWRFCNKESVFLHEKGHFMEEEYQEKMNIYSTVRGNIPSHIFV